MMLDYATKHIKGEDIDEFAEFLQNVCNEYPQGSISIRQGCMCPLGALLRAVGQPAHPKPNSTQVYTTLREFKDRIRMSPGDIRSFIVGYDNTLTSSQLVINLEMYKLGAKFREMYP